MHTRVCWFQGIGVRSARPVKGFTTPPAGGAGVFSLEELPAVHTNAMPSPLPIREPYRRKRQSPSIEASL
jgi:hypothetical protein